MHSPLLLDLLARERMKTRQAEAAQDALAAQLHRSSDFRPDLMARQLLAGGLRVIADRLDPGRLGAAPAAPSGAVS